MAAGLGFPGGRADGQGLTRGTPQEGGAEGQVHGPKDCEPHLGRWVAVLMEPESLQHTVVEIQAPSSELGEVNDQSLITVILRVFERPEELIGLRVAFTFYEVVRKEKKRKKATYATGTDPGLQILKRLSSGPLYKKLANSLTERRRLRNFTAF